MKVALAVALVVVIAGLAECRPQLQSALDAKLGSLKKRGGGEFEWPYGWIEFAQLIGKCESAINMLAAFNVTLDEDDADVCILAAACPVAMEAGGELLDASEEEVMAFGKALNEHFHILQCVNLEAVKESVIFALYMNDVDAKDNIYLNEAGELFNLCGAVFESLEEEEKEFEKDLEEAEGALGDKKRSLQLRKLISIASRKY
ncbi:hypothetical protein ACF0H5_020536 [Mactra antiquata]